jgi:hypothetical protein
MTPLRLSQMAWIAFSLVAFSSSPRAPDPRRYDAYHAILDAMFVDTQGNDLMSPQAIAADERRVIAYDAKDTRIVALASTGERLWRVARPVPLSSNRSAITDVQLASNGEAWLIDPVHQSFTVVSPDGRTVRTIAAPAAVDRWLPLGNGTSFVANTPDSTGFLSLFSGTAQVTKRIPLPSNLATVHRLAREFRIARLGSTGFVVSFRWSSRLIGYANDGTLLFDAPGVHVNQPFPGVRTYALSPRGGQYAIRVDPQAKEETRGACATDSALLVLSAHEDARGMSIVDRYAARSGQYLDSFVAPESLLWMACTSQHVIGLSVRRDPTIVRFHLQPSLARRPAE